MKNIAFIFDLDGVIVDTAHQHFLAWSKIAQSLDYSLSLKKNEALKGISRIESLKKIVRWSGQTISDDKFRALAHEKNEYYLALIKNISAKNILPGVTSFIRQAHSKGHPIALGSASKNAPLILNKTGLAPYFGAVIDGNSVTKAKPNPEVFLKAAESLGVAPENCVVFEDSEAGLEAAKSAKMTAVGIGQDHLKRITKLVFETFEQITYNEFLNTINP